MVMTSNVGSAAIAKGRQNSIGGFFHADDDESASYAGLKSLVMEELKSYFRPELLNRIDEVVVFRSLEKTQVRLSTIITALLVIMLSCSSDDLSNLNMSLNLLPSASYLVSSTLLNSSY